LQWAGAVREQQPIERLIDRSRILSIFGGQGDCLGEQYKMRSDCQLSFFLVGFDVWNIGMPPWPAKTSTRGIRGNSARDRTANRVDLDRSPPTP